jgi:Histidine kinase
VTAAGATVYSLANRDIMSGNTGNLWSAAFFATAILAAWLAGVFVRGRREAAAHAGRTAAAEQRAERAVADERARLARELHDIVSHNLSVVILQAASAQAAGARTPGRRRKSSVAAGKPWWRCAGCSACCASQAISQGRRGIAAAGHRGPGCAGRGRARGRAARAAGHQR